MKKISKYSPIIICGKEYRLFWNPNQVGGGFFEGNDCKIEVGTDTNEQNIYEALIHEIGEVIMMELGHRYSCHALDSKDQYLPNEDYLFILTHRDWDNFSQALAGALKKFLIPLLKREKKKKRKNEKN